MWWVGEWLLRGLVRGRWHGSARPYDPIQVARIGKGALGGKGRGYRFLHSFLDSYLIEQHFGDVRITVPRSVILATGVFDEFVDDNELLQQAKR